MTDKTTAHTLGGADPIKEAVERLIDDISDSQPSSMVVVESNDLSALITAYADLRSKLYGAAKALGPFAKCAERLRGPDEQTLFGWTGKHMVTLGDFRSASSTLKDIGE